MNRRDMVEAAVRVQVRSGAESTRHCLTVVFVMFAAAILSTNLHASTRHALLVGVSEYPNLDEKFQLEGPKYDVRLARDFLIESGFDRKQMRVLADGVEGADGLPTSAAIKQALASLANDSQKGDFVYVHFAGHGSQQPITQLISHIMRRMDSMRYSCLET